MYTPNPFLPHSFQRMALLVLITAFLSTFCDARADEIRKFTGFTRPGSPGDSRSGGKIRFIADVKKFRDKAVGATVYFTVLKKNGNDNDPWGLGVPNAAKLFKPGIDADGSFSPDLDPDAKYLYLYQVVNDRRTFQPIQSASIEILVDFKEITSWGGFNGLGFGTLIGAPKDNLNKIRSVSFNNSPAIDESSKMYSSPAPPISLKLDTVWVPTKEGQAQPKKKSGELVQVSWDALDPARDPNLVMLITDTESATSTGSLRAIWNGKSGLEKDSRSTIFGFTSPLKPKYVSVRIQAGVDEDLKEDKDAKVRLAKDGVQASGLETVGIQAEGRVPSPFSVIPAADEPVAPGIPPPPVLPQNPPLLPPSPSVAPGGSAAVSPGAPFGVGNAGGFAAAGFGGGSGSGDSSSDGGVQQSQQGREQGDQKINFNATLINQQTQSQAQAQAQAQLQAQKQSQRQRGKNGDGPAVPDPHGWLLASIGLPVLIWMRRRRSRRQELKVTAHY